MKSIRQSFVVSPRMKQMLEDIQQHKGYLSISQAVTESISVHHMKLFGAPRYNGEHGLAYNIKEATPEEEKERQRMANKEQYTKRKKEEKDEEARSICTAMGGEVKGGLCFYYKYSDTERYMQEIPLSRMNPDMISNQYSPSREKVEELQRKGKVKY